MALFQPNPDLWCHTLEDEHLWREGFCAACGRKRVPITADTPIMVFAPDPPDRIIRARRAAFRTPPYPDGV